MALLNFYIVVLRLLQFCSPGHSIERKDMAEEIHPGYNVFKSETVHSPVLYKSSQVSL